MLRGQDGTGKSYFLLMVSAFIEARVMLSGFESRLENADIMNETLLNLLKSIAELGTVRKQRQKQRLKENRVQDIIRSNSV